MSRAPCRDGSSASPSSDSSRPGHAVGGRGRVEDCDRALGGLTGREWEATAEREWSSTSSRSVTDVLGQDINRY